MVHQHLTRRGTEGPEGSVEGWAILLAVVIVVSVASTNDWQKQRQFKELQDQMKDDTKTTVYRDGEKTTIKQAEVVVGDILWIETGNVLPGDAIYISGDNLKADESAFTGESDMIHKGDPTVDPDLDPFFYGGSGIQEGGGKALCIAVGENSFNGKIMMSIMNKGSEKSDESSESSEESDEDENVDEMSAEAQREYQIKKEEKSAKSAKSKGGDETPLELKLESLAELIGICGTVAAGSLLVVLIIIYFVSRSAINADLAADSATEVKDVLHFVITAITIIVVAVPEGLPLAVTIALAFSMKKMMKDNNLVRHLKACETMGGASNICTDKTGTLTLNEMKVVAGNFYGVVWKENNEPSEWNFPKIILDSIALNTTVYFDKNAKVKEMADVGKKKDTSKKSTKGSSEGKGKKGKWTGNKTELALVDFVEEQLDCQVQPIRDERGAPRKTIPFSSERKRMSTAYDLPGGSVRIFTKGASEIILSKCNRYEDADGIHEMTPKVVKQVTKAIGGFAKDALRVIGFAYIDTPDVPDWTTWKDDDMIFLGIVGIKDPLRPSVPKAVEDCQKAGILVRMVTGDNLETAKNIAKNAGILTKGGLALEGPAFRQLNDKEIDKILPKLQVLARSSPLDKKLLVHSLRRHNLVVAVTGDGTNDAPALSLADVGFSMGIAGTEVCKMASDIVLLDDNFASIVQAVLWGRNVYDGIRKFVQFQLTVNVVAVLTAYIGAVQDAVSGGAGESPLTPIQLLWVNLIMDTFAALALATDPPRPELLERKPYGRTENIINKTMWKNIFGQSLYQIAITLLILNYTGFFAIAPYKGDILSIVASDPFCQKYMPDLFDRNSSGWDVTSPDFSSSYDGGYDFWKSCGPDDIEFSSGDTSSSSGIVYTLADLQCQCVAEKAKKIQYTFVFNAFVWMQVFNELNCRRIQDSEWNVFEGFFTNYLFLGIVFGTAAFQALYVNTFGEIGGVTRIQGDLWGWSILFGVISLPLGFLLKLLPYALPFLRPGETEDVNELKHLLSEESGEEETETKKSSESDDSDSSTGSEASGWLHVQQAVDKHAVLSHMTKSAGSRAGLHISARKHLKPKYMHAGWE